MGVGETAAGDASAVGVMGACRRCRVWPQLGMRDSSFTNCAEMSLLPHM